MARAVVSPNRCKYVPMREMNVTGYPITLPVVATLADLEAVEMVGDSSGPACVQDEGRDTERNTEPKCASALLNRVDPSIPTEAREALCVLLRRFVATSCTGENDFGRADVVRHRIDTDLNRLFRQALRRHPTVMVELIDAQVNAMLKADLIEPAQSEWGSNVVMVWKSDGILRFCVEHRQINERTVPYPPSRIDVCLDALTGATGSLRLTSNLDTIR